MRSKLLIVALLLIVVGLTGCLDSGNNDIEVSEESTEEMVELRMMALDFPGQLSRRIDIYEKAKQKYELEHSNVI
jgi:hypothetical protein